MKITVKIENKQTKQNQKEIWLPNYLYFNLLQVNRTFRINVVHPVVGQVVHAKTLKRGFTLKTSTPPWRNLKTQKYAVILDFRLEKTRIDRENHIIVVFKKLRSPTAFLLSQNVKLALSNFSRLKNFFNKLRFRDVLMWKVGLTV